MSAELSIWTELVIEGSESTELVSLKMAREEKCNKRTLVRTDMGAF